MIDKQKNLKPSKTLARTTSVHHSYRAFYNFQACALNHSAISPTVFPPAPNRMVIRQWTLIFHEFAPGASSFGTATDGGVPRTPLPECDPSPVAAMSKRQSPVKNWKRPLASTLLRRSYGISKCHIQLATEIKSSGQKGNSEIR
jgi:hypothetical protein